MNMLKESYVNDSDYALVMPSNRAKRYDVITVVDEYLDKINLRKSKLENKERLNPKLRQQSDRNYIYIRYNYL